MAKGQASSPGTPNEHYRRRQLTIADVASKAGVSAGIVSRVLSGDPTLRVREETRARVRAAAAELDYTPSPVAQALRRSVAGALGLAVHNMADPLHAEVVRGAQQRASEAGYVVLLADAEQLASGALNPRDFLDPHRVDGLILHPSGVDSDLELQHLGEGRLPTVVTNARLDGALGSVSLDDRALVRTAVEHLVSLGHREIGMINGLADAQHARRRRRAMVSALEAAGLEARESWLLDCGWDEHAGYDGLGRLLAARRQPTAVVVANVVPAIGLLAAARDHGLAVPDELSVVAIHDTWFARHTVPSLTTVAAPLSELGSASVELILELLAGTAARHVVLRRPRPQLLARASTAAPGPQSRAGTPKRPRR